MPPSVGFFRKIVLPLLAENMLGHFHHDVVGGHGVVVAVAAQALQAGGAGSERFHGLALRQCGFVFLDFFLLAEFYPAWRCRGASRQTCRSRRSSGRSATLPAPSVCR